MTIQGIKAQVAFWWRWKAEDKGRRAFLRWDSRLRVN